MSSRLTTSLAMQTALLFLLSGLSLGQSSSTFSLGDRVACRTAIEQLAQALDALKPAYEQAKRADGI